MNGLYEKAKDKMKIVEMESRDCLGRKIDDSDDDEVPDLE